MNPARTAVILIGFQDDYFSPTGVLHRVIQQEVRTNRVLEHTLDLLRRLRDTPALMVSTPIVFTDTYAELIDPVGILKTIRDAGAFKAGTPGAATIPELAAFGERILEVPGKRGLNAFSNTALDELLRSHRIRDVVLAGVVTSISIDSTGREAFERGYRVIVLSDCTAGRTALEQRLYCEQIFPLYAAVLTSHELLARLEPHVAAPVR